LATSGIAAVALAALYGMSDEFHQSFVPHRDVELGDVIADTAGAFVSVGALWLWGIIKRFF
jgi:VanZ family protein